MNKDFENLASAYELITEAKKKLSPAQKKIAAAAPPPDEITGDDFKALKKKKGLTKESEEIADAYQQILEASATDKVVNKKLARRYYKVVRALLKCEHGSKDYQKLKDEKEDIVKIVSDHGKSIADLDELLTKKEKEEVAGESGEDNKVNATACTSCGGDHTTSSCQDDGGTPA
jgi:hypothetical protein